MKTRFATLALAVFLPTAGLADTLVVRAAPFATSAAFETVPRLGTDSTGPVVVYTSQALVDAALAPGDIFSQRIKNGIAFGPAQLISDGMTDDQMNDIDGDRIVYSAFEGAGLGTIMMFDSTLGAPIAVSDNGPVREARIHGNDIVWVSGVAGATSIMYMNTAWIGTSIDPFPIGGPSPAATNVEIGSTYAVWDERMGSDRYIVAFELATGARLVVSSNPNLQERLPATYGDWVVWESRATDSTSSSIFARNLATNELRTVADNGANNLNPAIHRDHIVFESDRDGDYDIYLYRISDGVTYQVTDAPGDQFLADIHHEFVAWVDDQSGNLDVWVAVFHFIPDTPNTPPVADAGVNQAVVAGDTVTLDGSGSTDADLDALSYRWTMVSVPAGSTASLSAPGSAVTAFVADVAGSYAIELIVSDGLLDSAPAIVTVQAITPQLAATQTLASVVAVINALPATSANGQAVLKNNNMRNALTNKINAVLADIGAGNYATAYSKLTDDIIPKTDGCALTGAADHNDWINTCPEQAQVYSILQEVLAYLEPLV